MKKHWYTNPLSGKMHTQVHTFAVRAEIQARRAIDELGKYSQLRDTTGEAFFLKLSLPNAVRGLEYGQYLRFAPIRYWQIRRRQRILTNTCERLVAIAKREAQKGVAA